MKSGGSLVVVASGGWLLTPATTTHPDGLTQLRVTTANAGCSIPAFDHVLSDSLDRGEPPLSIGYALTRMGQWGTHP